MNTLATWLQAQLASKDLTQQAAAVYAGVSPATLSEIINREHIPKMETLFRLADYFDTPREHLLRLVARLPLEDSEPVAEDDYLVPELVEEFRRVPDDWKPVVLQQVQLFARLANQPPVRIIGDEPEEGEREAEARQDTQAA